ncbi:MAG: DNA recombination protein RmuC [Gammaproteobacteria bacterium]
MDDFFSFLSEFPANAPQVMSVFYYAGGAVALVLLVLFWVNSFRTRQKMEELHLSSESSAKLMERNLVNFAGHSKNVTNLSAERLKTDINNHFKKLKQAQETRDAEQSAEAARFAEAVQKIADDAGDYRVRMEERLDKIAELARPKPPEETPAETAALRALADIKTRLDAAVSDTAAETARAAAETARAQNAAEQAEQSDEKAREQLEKLSLYLHDEFAAVAAKLARPAAAPAALEELAQLNAQITALQNRPAENPAAEALAKIGKQLAALQEQFAALQNRPQPGAEYPALLEMLNQSMNRLGAEVDAKLTLLNSKLEKNMETRWSDALSSMNALREQIEELAGAGEQIKNINQNMTSLSRLMQARSGGDETGARQQLSELLAQILPAEHFMLDVDLPNGHCAAAIVRFPDPKDSVVIDAGLPLLSFVQSLDETLPADERDAKRQAFRQELLAHINHVADCLIAPPDTGESALLFVASESAFAEIHARHRAAVKLALSRRVWLVSPTTLLAVVNTANTAIRDHQARLQLRRMQESVAQIVEEARHFENRLTEIGDHVNSAWRSVQRAENASGRLIGSIRGIAQQPEENERPPIANDS